MLCRRLASLALAVTIVPLALLLMGCPSRAPGDIDTLMLPGGVLLEMVWIPPGSFEMGRYAGEQDSDAQEDPQHEVTFSSGFWIGRYELTKRQWSAVMSTTPWEGESGVLDDSLSPAVCVSWNDAQVFVAALNAYTGLNFRLPSEAEWEYACRASTVERFYWGDDPGYTLINDYAWWWDNASGVSEAYAHVVGLKLPNAWGLYDMSGNVWEWCEDDSHSDYTGAPTDGAPWMDWPRGYSRVRRGGGWAGGADKSRSANRYTTDPSFTTSELGFRLAR